MLKDANRCYLKKIWHFKLDYLKKIWHFKLDYLKKIWHFKITLQTVVHICWQRAACKTRKDCRSLHCGSAFAITNVLRSVPWTKRRVNWCKDDQRSGRSRQS